MRGAVIGLLLLLVVAALALPHDNPHVVGHRHLEHECHAHGAEFRRRFGCAAVKHTKLDTCCWVLDDGVHVGTMPKGCCGTQWDTECEDIIEHVCDNVHMEDHEVDALHERRKVHWKAHAPSGKVHHMKDDVRHHHMKDDVRHHRKMQGPTDS